MHGRVETWVTPGGHRRFDRRTLERLATDRRRGIGRPLASLGASPEHLNRVYRRHYAADAAAIAAGAGHRAQSPDDPDREAYRQDGRRLIAALIDFLDADADDARTRDRLEGDARDIVDDQASRLAAAGTSLTDAVSQIRRRSGAVPRRAVRPRPSALARSDSTGRPVWRRVRDPRPAAPAVHRHASGTDRAGRAGGALTAMDLRILLPAVTSILALVFSLALFDQWRERRGGFQLIWAFGMLFYGIAAGAEALAGLGGWNEALYRTWYLTGAVWTAGWLGLGTAFLLGRTRFGYTFAVCLFLAGLFTFLVRNRPEYQGAGSLPLLYFIAAAVLALAIAVETYFQNERWPTLAAGAVVGATVLSLVLMVTTTLPAPGYARRCRDRDPGRDALPAPAPAADAVPQRHRCLRPDPWRGILDVHVHAQTSRPALLARPEPEGRRVPVQPAHRPGRHHRQPVGLVAGCCPRARDGTDPQPGARDHPHRGRCVHPDA